ncbi:MAG: hypothetical protein AAFP77_21505 [Bacteroidota bacterium]
MIISVLNTGQAEKVNETYLCRKLDLTPTSFREQYRSFKHLIQACANYCVFLLQTELDVVWKLGVNAVQKLYYSMVTLQRPENQKRRHFFIIVEAQFPILAAELKQEMRQIIQKHFQRLLIAGKQEALILPHVKAPVTANRLWYLNGVALQHSMDAKPTHYWLEGVVHVLWPIVSQLFTIAGHQSMEVSLATDARTFNQYGQ